MKKGLVVFLALFLVNLAYSQEINDEIIKYELQMYCTNFDKAKILMNDFLTKNNPIITNITEKENYYYSDIFISENQKVEFDSIVPLLGFVYFKNTETLQNNVKSNEIQLELNYLNERKVEYDKEINSLTEKNDKYYSYWEEVRKIDNQIFELNKSMLGYKTKSSYQIVLTLYDDAVDMTDRKVNWVNMPGASFDFLMIENPVSDISGKYYMGYSLKYMITKGKCYFTLGNLKEFEPQTKDTLRYTEFFNFGFGQDFYTKHFGRGKREWFNLYTGYNVGGIFATSKNDGLFVPYAKVFLGVEIFKNRYFLIDNKIGYFVPFVNNRNFRGIDYSFSFNFVF